MGVDFDGLGVRLEDARQSLPPHHFVILLLLFLVLNARVQFCIYLFVAYSGLLPVRTQHNPAPGGQVPGTQMRLHKPLLNNE